MWSYVVVNQPEKQFPVIEGVLGKTSLNSTTGSSGAITSFGSPQAMNLLQDQLKAVRLNNGTSLTHTLIMSIKNISQISLLVYSFGFRGSGN